MRFLPTVAQPTDSDPVAGRLDIALELRDPATALKRYRQFAALNAVQGLTRGSYPVSVFCGSTAPAYSFFPRHRDVRC